VLLLAQASTVFAPPAVIPGIGSGHVVGPLFLVSDLNQDGLPDIAANTDSTRVDTELAVLLNQGDGGFDTTLYPMPTAGQIVSVPHPGTAPDIAFNMLLEPGLQVLKNSGHGVFSVGPFYPVAEVGAWLTVGDFNGDCIPDIAIDTGSWCPDGTTSSVSVLYGDGDGGFGAPTSLRVTEHVAYGMASLGSVGNPRAFAVGDACGTGVTVYGDASKP
jgi:hypothetical protein